MALLGLCRGRALAPGVGGFFLLSHEPLYVNRNMPYANVFGHVHGNPAYRDVSPRSVCVSVERTGFAPLSARELRERLQNEQSV